MSFIEGYLIFKTPYLIETSDKISHIYISNTQEPVYQNEHLVTDKHGNICIFNCTTRTQNTVLNYRGFLKYKTGSRFSKYTLKTGLRNTGDFVIIDGVEYSLLKHLTTGNEKILRYNNKELVYSNEEYEYEEIDPIYERHWIFDHIESYLIDYNVKIDKYVQLIIAYIKTLKLSYHSGIRYFCFSNVDELYGTCYYYFMNGFVYHKIILTKCGFVYYDKFSGRGFIGSNTETSGCEIQDEDILDTQKHWESNIKIDSIVLADGGLSINNINESNFWVYSNKDSLFICDDDYFEFKDGLGDLIYLHSDYIVLTYKNYKIYELSNYKLSFDIPETFIQKFISCVLLEENIIIVSRDDAFLKAQYLLDLIKPFKVKHLILLPLLSTIEDILDSPIPYIVSASRSFKDEFKYNNVVVDFDKYTVKNYDGPVIGFYEDTVYGKYLSTHIKFCKMLAYSLYGDEYVKGIVSNPSKHLNISYYHSMGITSSFFEEYKDAIASTDSSNTFVFKKGLEKVCNSEKTREKKKSNLSDNSLKSYRDEIFDTYSLVAKGEELFTKEFLEQFFETRIFADFIYEESFKPAKYVQDVVGDLYFIPPLNIKDVEFHEITGLWIEITDCILDDVIDYCMAEDILIKVSSSLIKKCVMEEAYQTLNSLIDMYIDRGIGHIPYDSWMCIKEYDMEIDVRFEVHENCDIWLVERCECLNFYFRDTLVGLSQDPECERMVDFILDKSLDLESDISRLVLSTRIYQSDDDEIADITKEIDQKLNLRATQQRGKKKSFIKKYLGISERFNTAAGRKLLSIFCREVICMCTDRATMIILKQESDIGVFNLLSVDNLRLALAKYNYTKIYENNREVYWNLVTYFMYFNFPINEGVSVHEDMYIIDDGEVDNEYVTIHY